MAEMGTQRKKIGGTALGTRFPRYEAGKRIMGKGGASQWHYLHKVKGVELILN